MSAIKNKSTKLHIDTEFPVPLPMLIRSFFSENLIQTFTLKVFLREAYLDTATISYYKTETSYSQFYKGESQNNC